MADTNPLQLSDEDFMNQDPADFLDVADDEASAPEEKEEQPEPAAEEADKAEDPETELPEKSGDDVDPAEGEAPAGESSEAQEEPEALPDGEKVGQPDGDTQPEPETSPDDKDAESLDTSDLDPKDPKGDTPETKGFDYESAYKKVTEPFKANGADIQVKDPQDIIRLMQMGANYNKKMAAMKPNLKVIKMLENNDLLDEMKLHNLIDLSKKDPKAVAKLIKESGIDPLDIDVDGPSDYKPTDYSVSDKEYNLDQVLDSIKGTESFNKTIDVLTKDWDAESKATVSDNPEIISIVNMHMENGVFDKVNAVLQQEKALGKLTGVSDVEAYRQIAESLHEKGILKEQGNKAEPSEVSKEAVTDEEKLKADEERKNKRGAAAPTRQNPSTKEKLPEKFLGLSDKEFMEKYA